jgi:DNA-binding GntR family transcriptional regulator
MTMRAQAYDAFTRHLLERRLAPGQFVTQRDLAALVGFPLGAIREMIPRLEAEGLVRTLAQRGLQIVGANPKLIRDAFRLREIIETEAITLFTRTASDAVIQDEIDKLEAISQAAHSETISENLLNRAQAIDWGFHDLIVENLDNALINDIHRVNAIRIRIMMYDRVTLSAELLEPALAEHRPILTAVRDRDATNAVAALRAHLQSARRRALGID